MALSQQQILLAEVLANPDDDIPRLVYADYLEDSGDPRGVFIRAQCHLAKSDFLEPEYYDWLEQSSILLREHGGQWAEEIKQDLRKSEFHRGFIEKVTVLASALVKDEGAIFNQTPINWMRLNRVKGKGEAIANLESLSRLRGLDISGIRIPFEDMAAILNSDHLTQLKGLKTIAYNSEFGAEECRALADSKAAKTLSHLELIGYPQNLESICSGAGFPSLTHLTIQTDLDNEEQVNTLAGLKNLEAKKLESLTLAMTLNPTDISGLESSQWKRLKNLNIHDSVLVDGFLTNLVDTGTFESLEKFQIEMCELPQSELELLFNGENFKNCHELNLQMVTDDLANELMPIISSDTQEQFLSQFPEIERLIEKASNHKELKNLKRFKISHLPSGKLATLLKPGNLDQLESLTIWSSLLSEEDIAALSESPLSKNLKSFQLAMVDIIPEGIRRLEKTEFPNLIHAQFGSGYDHFSLLPHEAIQRLLSGNTFQTLKYLNLDWVNLSLSKLAASANLPDLRMVSQQNTRGVQKEVKALLESDRFEKLFKLKMTGSFAAKDSERLQNKFGPKLEI